MKKYVLKYEKKYFLYTTLIFLSKKNLLLKFHFQEFYDDMSKATDAVRDGDLVGIMYFNYNFSEALQRRVDNYGFAKTEDIESSQIDVFLDMGGTYIYIIYDVFLIKFFGNLKNN